MGTGLLAVTFDLLAAALVTGPCDPTPFLHRHVWLRVRIISILYSAVVWQVFCTKIILWLQISYFGRGWLRHRTGLLRCRTILCVCRAHVLNKKGGTRSRSDCAWRIDLALFETAYWHNLVFGKSTFMVDWHAKLCLRPGRKRNVDLQEDMNVVR